MHLLVVRPVQSVCCRAAVDQKYSWKLDYSCKYHENKILSTKKGQKVKHGKWNISNKIFQAGKRQSVKTDFQHLPLNLNCIWVHLYTGKPLQTMMSICHTVGMAWSKLYFAKWTKEHLYSVQPMLKLILWLQHNCETQLLHGALGCF